MNKQEYINKAESVLMHTYGRFQIVLDKGEGMFLYDTDGKKYLDFCAGIAVFALGYADKPYNDALKAQIDKVIHTSNYFYNVPAIEASELVLSASGMDRIFFTNSGTEAVEGAIKLARKVYFEKHGKADSEIISMNHSFHGRSMGALSVTGTKKYREPFEPLIGGSVFAEYNNLSDVLSKINDKTAGIIIETIQGEGGIYPASEEFLKGVRKACDEKGIVLILDEIQCGMGRTGSMFAYEKYGVKPDIVTMAKALGCGVPVGAFAATEKVASAFKPGDHGTTYGGNPFACAAVCEVFKRYNELDILKNVNETGAYLFEKLEELKSKHSNIVAHRGIGLIQGLEFNEPVKPIINKTIENGLILIAAGENIIRFLPPLIAKKSDVDAMIKILDSVL